MSFEIIETMVEDLVVLQEEGLQEEITLGHIGSVAIMMFHNHLISGGLKAWMRDDSTDGHLEILIHLTDDAFEQGVKDIRAVNRLFRRIESINSELDPEVEKITEEYVVLDEDKLIKAYSDSVLLHFNLNKFFK